MIEIIKKRRSVRPTQFNNVEIRRSEIEKILEAANWAPTHKKTEPWRFKVFQGDAKAGLGQFLADKFKKTAKTFSDFKYNKLKEGAVKSSCIVAICFQRDPKECLPEWEELAAVAMAVQNMWLMATSLDIKGYWSSPGLIKHIGEHIRLKEGEQCLGFFYMGYSDEEIPEREPGSIADKVEWF